MTRAFATPPPGVHILRPTVGRGYLAPAPGHGPHRYVFQLFALPEPMHSTRGKPVASARAEAVLATARAVARVDGFFERF